MRKRKYTLTYEDEGCDVVGPVKVEISFDEETLSDVMAQVKGFLLAVGFHPDSVNEYVE